MARRTLPSTPRLPLGARRTASTAAARQPAAAPLAAKVLVQLPAPWAKRPLAAPRSRPSALVLVASAAVLTSPVTVERRAPRTAKGLPASRPAVLITAPLELRSLSACLVATASPSWRSGRRLIGARWRLRCYGFARSPARAARLLTTTTGRTS